MLKNEEGIKMWNIERGLCTKIVVFALIATIEKIVVYSKKKS